mgnify:CR=1 FL=1
MLALRLTRTRSAAATSDVHGHVLADHEHSDDLEHEDEEEDDEVHENLDTTPTDDVVWEVPVINPGAGQIRFAEDVADNTVKTQKRRNSGPRSNKKGNRKFSSRR